MKCHTSHGTRGLTCGLIASRLNFDFSRLLRFDLDLERRRLRGLATTLGNQKSLPKAKMPDRSVLIVEVEFQLVIFAIFDFLLLLVVAFHHAALTEKFFVRIVVVVVVVVVAAE